jgi:beta-lactamase class A
MKRSGFILGCTAAALWPRAGQAASLESTVASLDAQSSGKLAVYARAFGKSQPLIAYRANDDYPSASTIKLLIMVAAFRRKELQEPDFFSRKVTLRAEQFTGGSDVLQNYDPGDKVAVSTLIWAMITVSDNTASNALIDLLSYDAVNRTAEVAGLTHTHLGRHFVGVSPTIHVSRNRTSAADMGRLLYLIETGAHEGTSTVVSVEGCRRMVHILLNQEDHDKIPVGLPRGTPIAHKTGEIDGVRNDVGIIDPFGDHPYILAILTKDLDDLNDGMRAIHIVAREVNRQLHG